MGDFFLFIVREGALRAGDTTSVAQRWRDVLSADQQGHGTVSRSAFLSVEPSRRTDPRTSTFLGSSFKTRQQYGTRALENSQTNGHPSVPYYRIRLKEGSGERAAGFTLSCTANANSSAPGFLPSMQSNAMQNALFPDTICVS